MRCPCSSHAAIVLAARPASDRHSYGLHRGEILAALLNGLTVALIAGWIFFEAWERLSNPREVRVGGMMAVAGAGLVANAVVARLLHVHHHDDLNGRGAYLHVIGDLLASAAVVAGRRHLGHGLDARVPPPQLRDRPPA